MPEIEHASLRSYSRTPSMIGECAKKLTDHFRAVAVDRGFFAMVGNVRCFVRLRLL